jgi:arsenate reductase
MKIQTVLFVCVHNSGRSQIAEAMTNAFAKRDGLPVRAVSAGTMGGKTLNPMAVEALAEIGISMEGQTPKIMTQDMVREADKIISMGCGVDADACPTRFILTEDWGLDDPAGQPIEKVRVIRDQIQEHVTTLLSEMCP